MSNSLKIALVFTCLCIANTIVFVILHCLGIFEADVGKYLLIALYFVMVWVPIVLNKLFKFKLGTWVEIFYQIFLVCAILVGSSWGVFMLNSWYDKVVHVLCGALFGLIIYSILVNGKSQKLSPLAIALFAFSFAMMICGMWEICEYLFDAVFPSQNTQRWEGLAGRDALTDTMLDLICDFAGSLVSAIAIFFTEHHKNHSSVLHEPE